MARRWALGTAVVGATLASFLLAVTPATAAAVPDAWTSEFGGAGNARTDAGETALTPGAVPGLALGWARAGATSAKAAPTVVAGVGYAVVDAAAPNGPSQFQAFAARTGRTLWSIELPRGGTYPRGVTVVGHLALMSFDGVGRPGGITAVGLDNRHVVWSAAQPAGAPGTDRTVSGQIVSDGSFVYLLSGTGAVEAHRLADGVRVWRVAVPGPLPDGIALGNKVLFTGGANGLVAHDTATGAVLWTAPGVGAPLVAGGRVVTAAARKVIGVAAAGCGAPTCAPLWNTTLPYPNATATRLGGFDGTYLYLAYTDTVKDNGGLVRIGAISGRVIWRAPIAAGAVAPVSSGAGTVWTVVGGRTLLGFATDATAARPLVAVTERADLQGADQSLAVASGRVFVRSSPAALAAYAVPAA